MGRRSVAAVFEGWEPMHGTAVEIDGKIDGCAHHGAASEAAHPGVSPSGATVSFRSPGPSCQARRTEKANTLSASIHLSFARSN
jgi:hypothetical protein